MKNLSIKWQLTIWYAFTIFAISATLFIAFFKIMATYLILETDRSLYTHASQVAYNIGLNTDNIFDSQTDEIIEVSKSQIPGIFITETDISGHDIRRRDDGEFQELASTSIKNNREAFTSQSVNGTWLRLISFPIRRDVSIIGTIIMGHPIDVYQNALGKLKTLALLLAAFLLLPAVALGYLLASQATRPIEILTQKMQEITTENLAERVKVPSKSLETFNLVQSFNGLLDRLNDAFNTEKEFIAEAAHRIKTPLAVIKSNAEVTISKDRSVEDYKKSLTQVLVHVEKLSKSLSNLIDFAWSQTLDTKKQFVRINLSKLLEDLVEDLRTLSSQKDLAVGSELISDVFVLGRDDKLTEAFNNIFDNAVKFTEVSGQISIKLSKKDNQAVVEVSDTGVGIDSGDLKTIFDRFYRSESAKNIKGHGIGLAVTNSIIKAHAGRIEVKSAKQQGSTFTISIPTIE